MKKILEGIRVVEVGGKGAAPFAGMLLADHGADVTVVDRLLHYERSVPLDGGSRFLRRGKRSIMIDLKSELGKNVLLRMIEGADVVIEGFRPGTLERLGVGPDVCRSINKRLIVGRVTGWGQDGPYAQFPGHDINFIAVGGILGAIGLPDGGPIVPLNLIGDFAGGGMLLGFGIVMALLQRERSGEGTVIDASMLDGATLLATHLHGLLASGEWSHSRGVNRLDGGAPYYHVYETADGRYVAVGAIEDEFYERLLKVTKCEKLQSVNRHDRTNWSMIREELARAFHQRTRDEWSNNCDAVAACISPVLEPWEAPYDAHVSSRGLYYQYGQEFMPSSAPRFGGRGRQQEFPTISSPGRQTTEIMREYGFSEEEIDQYIQGGAVMECP